MLLIKQGVFIDDSYFWHKELKITQWVSCNSHGEGWALSSKLMHAILEIKNHLRENSEHLTHSNDFERWCDNLMPPQVTQRQILFVLEENRNDVFQTLVLSISKMKLREEHPRPHSLWVATALLFNQDVILMHIFKSKYRDDATQRLQSGAESRSHKTRACAWLLGNAEPSLASQSPWESSSPGTHTVLVHALSFFLKHTLILF